MKIKIIATAITSLITFNASAAEDQFFRQGGCVATVAWELKHGKTVPETLQTQVNSYKALSDRTITSMKQCVGITGAQYDDCIRKSLPPEELSFLTGLTQATNFLNSPSDPSKLPNDAIAVMGYCQ